MNYEVPLPFSFHYTQVRQPVTALSTAQAQEMHVLLTYTLWQLIKRALNLIQNQSDLLPFKSLWLQDSSSPDQPRS